MLVVCFGLDLEITLYSVRLSTPEVHQLSQGFQVLFLHNILRGLVTYKMDNCFSRSPYQIHWELLRVRIGGVKLDQKQRMTQNIVLLQVLNLISTSTIKHTHSVDLELDLIFHTKTHTLHRYHCPICLVAAPSCWKVLALLPAISAPPCKIVLLIILG